MNIGRDHYRTGRDHWPRSPKQAEIAKSYFRIHAVNESGPCAKISPCDDKTDCRNVRLVVYLVEILVLEDCSLTEKHGKGLLLKIPIFAVRLISRLTGGTNYSPAHFIIAVIFCIPC